MSKVESGKCRVSVVAEGAVAVVAVEDGEAAESEVESLLAS